MLVAVAESACRRFDARLLLATYVDAWSDGRRLGAYPQYESKKK